MRAKRISDIAEQLVDLAEACFLMNMNLNLIDNARSWESATSNLFLTATGNFSNSEYEPHSERGEEIILLAKDLFFNHSKAMTNDAVNQYLDVIQKIGEYGEKEHFPDAARAMKDIAENLNQNYDDRDFHEVIVAIKNLERAREFPETSYI